MLKSGILNSEGIYEINDSKKTPFANSVLTEDSPYVFAQFVDLFKKIDMITGVEVDYDEVNRAETGVE